MHTVNEEQTETEETLMLLENNFMTGNTSCQIVWLRHRHHKADGNRTRKTVQPEYPQHQMVSPTFTLHLLGNSK
jgi:hypothetical protein